MGKTVRKSLTNTSNRAERHSQANSQRLLDRTIGMETEYSVVATVHHDREQVFDFESFLSQVRKSLPMAPSLRNHGKYFLANGGCFSIETGASTNLGNAYLEAATPECKSPMDLLESHLAMQQIATDILRVQYPDRRVRLIQGNHDGNGHTYGQHESYEVNVASGLSLIGWRLGIALLLPCVCVYRCLAMLWLTVILLMARVEFNFRLIARWASNSNLPKQKKEPSRNEPMHMISSGWIGACSWGLRVLHAPLAFLLWINIQLFALRIYRSKLAAFFASRCILDGAGHVDEQGLFRISARAHQANCMIGFGGYNASRPIFRCDSWLKDLCVGGPLALGGALRLFHKRQRVEIALGDSGICQAAQYVRIGSTSLVLDLAESGRNTLLPRLKRPLEAIRRFSRDWMLLKKEAGKDGSHLLASEIQNAYAIAVREMLENSRLQSFEAKRIVEIWQSLLSQLEQSEEKSCPSKDLVGRIDWITKLWLLHQLDNKSGLNARLKLDIRYHELTKEGYGTRVLELTPNTSIVQRERVARAVQNPPKDSPAVRRSYLIREFGEETDLAVDWEQASWTVEGKRFRQRFAK